jgi:hypothetical protein
MKFRLIVECDVELPDNVRELEEMGFVIDRAEGPVTEQVRSQQEDSYDRDFNQVVDQFTFCDGRPTIALTYHND